jgi:hypothetical protein
MGNFASTTYQPDSVTTEVGLNPAGSGAGGIGGFGELLNATAARRAFERDRAFKADQDRIAWEQRQAEQARRDHLVQSEMGAKQHNYEMNLSRQDQTRAIEGGGRKAQRWMKDLPGIGPVEVAAGTFGAYAAGDVDAPTAAYDQSVGLRPGLVGTSFSYLPGAGGAEVDPASLKAANEGDQASADRTAAVAEALDQSTRMTKAGWGMYSRPLPSRARAIEGGVPRSTYGDEYGGA